MIKHLPLLAVALIVPLTASAASAKTKRIEIPLPASQNPSNANLPIAGAVWAGDTLYLSGWLDPDRKTHTDTTSQAVGLLEDIQKFLAAQKLTMGDVVMMHVYLGADPAKDGKGDYAEDQPNKPARTTVQVVLPAASSGALIEIDLIAVRQK